VEIRYLRTPCWLIILVAILAVTFGVPIEDAWIIFTLIGASIFLLITVYIFYLYLNRTIYAKLQIKKDNNIMCPQCHNVLKPNVDMCIRCGIKL